MSGRYRSSFLLSAAAALLSLPLAKSQDLDIDDNVVWTEGARSTDILESIEVDALSEVSGSDNLIIPLNRLAFALNDTFVERSQIRTYRFQTAEAIRDFGNVLIYFDAATDSVRVNTALVIDADGQIHTIEPGTVQILSSDTLNVFSDQKIAVIPLPGLEIGATAIVAHTINTNRSDDIGPWGTVINQQYGVPQERLEISISWGAPELRPVWDSQLDEMTCTEPDALTVNCVALDIPAYPTDENAFYDDVVPQFVVAEERSWEELRDWYAPLFQSALSADETIATMADNLVDGLDTQTEKLRAIHRFVAEEVRYVALEHGDSAYVPHSTSTTLARRYGDCKDKAALLIDLLGHVGIDMTSVLVATARRETDKLLIPTRAYFDHLIVCGTLSNGRRYCLDVTDPYTGIDSLSGWIQGAVSLPVTPGASLSRLPHNEHSWIIRENVNYVLGPEGKLTERSNVEYAGAYGTSIRGNLAGLNSREMQDWAVNDYHRAVSDLVTPEFEFSGIEDINEGVTVTWEVDYDNLLDPTVDLYYSDVMPWLNQALFALETRNQTFSYRFPGLQFESTVTIDSDERWRIDEVGPEIDMRIRFGEFSRNYVRSAQSVEVRTEFAAPAAEIEVEDVESFNRFLELVREESLLHVRGPLQRSD